jgi:hypothetical protein
MRTPAALISTMLHDARPAERVGQDAVAPRLGVAALDAEHLVRVGHVPQLAAVPLHEAGVHELSAHGAVAEERAGLEGFE